MRLKAGNIFKLTVLPVFIFFSAQCVTNPVSGEKQLMLFSQEDELKIGQQTDQEIRQQFGLYEDSRLKAYIDQVGQRVAGHSHRKNLRYHFAVLDTPVVNAFAAPGGYVYLTRGILAFISSEAELAAIIGHEVGHIAARHSMKKLSDAILLNLGLAFGSIISEDFARVAGLAGLGANLLLLKYSRDDEYQADQLGIEYSRQAGYNPEEVIRFFRKLQKLEKASGSPRIPNFLSTHPLSEKRIEQCYQLLKEEDKRLLIDPESYLLAVNGIDYGANPRYGIVLNGIFYHPQWKLQFPLEHGWQVEGNASQFMLYSSDQKALLVGQKEPDDLTLEKIAGQKLAVFKESKILSQRDFQQGYLYCRLLSFLWRQEPGTEWNSSLLNIVRVGSLKLSLIALEEKNAGYNLLLQRTLSSVSQISERRILDLQPQKLVLIRGNGINDLAALFKANRVSENDFSRLALINSLALDSIPAKGRLIKIIQGD